MIDKIYKVLENIGVVAMIGAFLLFNWKWRYSDYLFWTALCLFIPVIIRKNWDKDLAGKMVALAALVGLFVVGYFCFNGPTIEIKIPHLHNIVIQRS
ncbi:MAG: hypothetical protein K6A32_00310 [Bacteroidales bacterium]|nr:hypothetical protein [Bacteroidales bacterium]